MESRHALRAITGIARRELLRYTQQKARLLAALVRPILWLVVFGTGFRQTVDLLTMQPYPGAVTYYHYLIPGLLAMILLFNGMQSSLSIVYDREMGVMRLLLTAPLPRWYLLLGKLLSSTIVSFIQVYLFLFLCLLCGYRFPLSGLIYILPVLLLGGVMLGSIGLFLTVYIHQLENFAGTMNFVIFPLFFLSSALYSLPSIRDSSEVMYWVACMNPLTHVVELIRFAMYGQLHSLSLLAVSAYCMSFAFLGISGYSPQYSLGRRKNA